MLISNKSVGRLTGGGSTIFGRRSSAAAIDDAKDRYTQALKQFKDSLTKYDENLLAHFGTFCTTTSPSQDDVVCTITAITNRVAETHTRHDRKHSANMSGFFERLMKLASVGDVIVGGAQNLAVSGAWGAVRLALEVRIPTTECNARRLTYWRCL